MRDESLSLRGATVQPLPRRNRQWKAGRRCAEPGCETTLSIYNKSKYCWTHDPVRYYVPRGRKKKPAEAA